ncbi:MAG TPA: O-antigen ligase family protein [Nitrospinota bacterium]|nr:O-antigen ligase family protein [Nitrospinota bacterium]
MNNSLNSELVDTYEFGLNYKWFISPWILSFFIIIFAITCYLFSIPETYASAFLVAPLVAITFLNPFNGLVLVLLAAPFFLGESGWHYYWIIEVLVYSTVLSAIFHKFVLLRNYKLVILWPMALLTLSSLFSLPIDGKEFIYDFWATSPTDLFWQWLVAHPAPKVHYFRIFMNSLTGVILFWVAYNFIKDESHRKFTSLVLSMAAVAIFVCICGLALYYNLLTVPEGTISYLSLSVVGRFGDSITAFSFALHFFGQYLLLTLPFLFFLLFDNLGKNHVLSIVAFLCVVLFSFLVIQGGLRTATVLLYIIFLVISIASMKLVFEFDWHKYPRNIVIVFITVIISGVGLTLTPAYDRILTELLPNYNSTVLNNLHQYIDDPLYFMREGISEPRFFLWHTAVRMFLFAPLLGIGMGRFTHLFTDFYNSDWYNWHDIGFASGATAHSTYFEILANQGLLGVLFFSVVLILIISAAHKSIKSTLNSNKALIWTLLSVILIGMLLAITHHVFLCRSIELLLWISLGMLAGTCSREIENLNFRQTLVRGSCFLLIIGLFAQMFLIYERPISRNYSTGFYNWELQPDGNVDRWMGKRGVVNVRGENGLVTLLVRCPLPGLSHNPQKVTVWYGGQVKTIEFSSDQLKVISFKLPIGAENAVVKLESKYVFNPEESGVSDDSRDLGVMLRWTGD